MPRRLLLFVMLALLAPPGMAADNPAPQDPDQAAAVAEEPAADQDSQADRPAGGDQAQAQTDEEAEEEESDARFIPTEEISQDLGVSFPVDI
ncbi:MAG: hypothetical protein WD396_02420, partial [Pseudohongiellaceae bacterium]